MLHHDNETLSHSSSSSIPGNDEELTAIEEETLQKFMDLLGIDGLDMA